MSVFVFRQAIGSYTTAAALAVTYGACSPSRAAPGSNSLGIGMALGRYVHETERI